MTQQPVDYASGPSAEPRASRLGTASLIVAVAGIVVGLGLVGIGELLGIGARGGGPGVGIALIGLISGVFLNITAFIMGIVALFRRNTSKKMAVIAISLSCAAMILLVVGMNA